MRLSLHIKIIILLCSIFYGYSEQGYSQNQCQILLRQAQQNFDRSLPEQTLKQIKQCLFTRNSFTSTEYLEVLRLLTISYVFNKDRDSADYYFAKMLKLDPEYRVDPKYTTYPEEVLHTLYRSFRTDPLFHLRLTFGGNLASVRELQYFSTVQNDSGDKEYSMNVGFQNGIGIAFPLTHHNLRLQFEANFAQIRYSLHQDMSGASIFSNPQSANTFTGTSTESQQWLQFPLLLSWDVDHNSHYKIHYNSHYNFQKNKKWVPFLYGGFTLHQMLGASFSQMAWSNGLQNSISSSSFTNITDIRYGNNLSATIGMGLKRKVGDNYLLGDIRYNYWLRNIVNDRYGDSDLVFPFGHVDSDYTFHTLTVSISYEMPFYRPKRLKSAF